MLLRLSVPEEHLVFLEYWASENTIVMLKILQRGEPADAPRLPLFLLKDHNKGAVTIWADAYYRQGHDSYLRLYLAVSADPCASLKLGLLEASTDRHSQLVST